MHAVHPSVRDTLHGRNIILLIFWIAWMSFVLKMTVPPQYMHAIFKRLYLTSPKTLKSTFLWVSGPAALETRVLNRKDRIAYRKWGHHDDVMKWKHFPRCWPFVRGIHRSPVNFPHKGKWRGALMFPLIFVWISGLVNNGEAGDLRRHRAHYDVIIMQTIYQNPYAIFTNKWMQTHITCHELSCLMSM